MEIAFQLREFPATAPQPIARAARQSTKHVLIFADVRQALRLIRRTPSVTALAILSTAIGASATAVVFTAVKAVLIEPFPFSHPDELVTIRSDFDRGGAPHSDWVHWNDAQDVRRDNHSFAAVGTYHYALFNLAGDRSSLPEALYGLFVSADLFPLLGVHPMIGRNILPEETQPGRDREMILSYGLWVRRFHSDPRVVGSTVEVNGHACRIIGVMPDGFDFPLRPATTVNIPSHHMDFWAPSAVDPAKATRASDEGFGAVARLRRGVSLAQAEQDLAAVSARLARDYPRANTGLWLHAVSLRARTLGFARTGLTLLMAAAAIFLLIGCANTANLLLARGLARHRELAVRSALGAGRGRIVRQLITESTLLAALGGLAGYAVTLAAWTLLPAVAPMSIPRLAAARADFTVFAFTCAVSLLIGISSGLAPALRLGRLEPADALRQSGTRGSIGASGNRLRSALVVSEVAVTVVLVVIGGLLTGSFVRLLRSDPGFAADRILASIIIPANDSYAGKPAAQAALFRRILDGVRALPDVASAGTVDALPFTGENNGGLVTANEAEALAPQQQEIAEVDRVSAGYLETMGVGLLAGRWFRDEDMQEDRRAAIINDVAAERLGLGANAVGRRVCVNCAPDHPSRWNEIIGVVSTIHHAALDEAGGSEVYLANDALGRAQFLVLRSTRRAAELAQPVRRAVAAADPSQPVFLSATMATLIGDSLADRRFIMTLLAVTGCLALLLSAAGVYGVMSYATGQRTQEIGVRMALGATPRQVHALIFRQGMSTVAFGLTIGIAAAVLLTRVLEHWLPGLRANDLTVAAAAALFATAAAALACWMPANRATRIDPLAALRSE